MLFVLLFFQKTLCDCSFRSNLITINDDTSLDDLKNEYKPLFLRLTSPGCPYSPASQVHWESAAELFPQVDFVTIDCWENTKICSLFGYPINTPYHGFVLANTSEVYDNEDAKFGRPTGANNIEKSPTKFIEVITKYANLYPISPPLANLVPMITDSFYQNAPDPIILLHNSQCSEEVPFLNAWSKAANEELVSNGDYPTIGLLDCSKYPDECQRWSRPYVVKTPRALVYSKKTGNFEILDTYNDITKIQIQNLITNANSLQIRPTPSPIPDPIPATPSLTPGDYELLENTNLQNRPLSEVKSKYLSLFKSPEGGPCLDGNCGNDHIDGPTCDIINPNPKDHESSLNVINAFRWLAGLPDDVTENEEWSTLCQRTAHTINRIGKVPSDHIIKDKYLTSYYCAETIYKQVALDSLLSENSNSCFESTYKLFKDEGSNNDGVVGHRRYLLHPNLKTVGFGFYPLKYEKFGENQYWIKPAVNVLRVKENNNVGYIENGVPSNIKFISWPPAGPFPIDHLPSNWHISHPMFKNVELSDLEILVTRDDGIELPISRIVLEKYNLNKDALILIMSAEALSRCTILHKINVFVKNNKDKKFIRYSFELFNTNEYTEICFYDNDQSKCPSSVSNNNKVGKDKYGTVEALSKATNLVKIYVVELIKLNEKLSFSAKQRFIISGNKIDGIIHIGPGSVIDFQDPGDTDFVIDWNVKSKSVGKLDTALKAKSISIQVLDETEEATLDNIVFYTGRETKCSISKSILRGEKYDVYYTFGGSNFQYFLISSPSSAYENFIVGNAFDIYTELEQDYPGTKINTLSEMKNQKTYKRVVRVFINPKQGDYFNIDAFISGTKKDYIFVKTGNAYQYLMFFCDYNIREVVNSITFQDLSDRFSSSFQPYTFNLVSVADYPRQRCEIDNITIKNAKYQAFNSKDIFFPSVKGDDTAKAQYPYVYIDQCTANEQNPNVFDTQRTSASGKTQTEIKIDGNHDEYIVKVDFKGLLQSSTLYKYITILPEEGAESKSYKFKFQDRDNLNDEYPISNDDFPIVYFENFKDITIEHPIVKDGKNYISKFKFIKCGKVSFSEIDAGQEPIDLGNKLVLSSSSDTQIDYGVPTKVVDLSADGEGTYHVPNIEAKTLTVSNHQEFIEVKVSEKISVDSSSLVLNKCKLNDNINIEIVKNKDSWPSVSLIETELKSVSIKIDLKIVPSENNVVSLLEIPYEEHIMIAGIDSGCDSFKNSVILENNGNYDLRCSSDNKNIIVARGEQPKYEEVVEDEESTSSTNSNNNDNDNNNGDDDVVTSNSNDKPVVVPSNDDDPIVVSSNDNPVVDPSKDGDGDNEPNGPGDGKGDDKKFPVGGIIGIVVGVIVVIVVVVVVVIVVKKKNNYEATSEFEEKEDTTGL